MITEIPGPTRDAAREVVITGAGVCSRFGDDVATTEAVLRTACAVPFDVWEPAKPYEARSRLCGLYRGPLAGTKHEVRGMGRAARLAYHAALIALAQARLERRDIAVVAGSGTGDVATLNEVQTKLDERKTTRSVSPLALPRMMASTVSANLATVLRTTGPAFGVTAACATGGINIAIAAQLIALGQVPAALAGGAEAADSLFHAGFEAMRAYNDDGPMPDPLRASRPYAADRTGFVFGEGAGIVVLETRASATARGADILGVVHGSGMSANGSGDMVSPSVPGAVAAMQAALRQAGLGPDDIDYVNTHGASTPAGDVVEIGALRTVFGGRRVPYSSTKGYTGHPISAGGALEAIFTCAMLRGGWIAPSIHAEPLDAALADYPPVTAPTTQELRHALSNSLGFGGTNVCLVLGRP
jgi:3-oxoacyl-[acyl-carrier-protein] synthase-1